MSAFESTDASQAEVICPEGVPLRFEIAGLPARVMAFGLDFFFITLISAALLLGGFLIAGASGWVQPLALGLVAMFLIRYFYFAFFEIAWHGTTPGKRRLGLRVVSKDGSSLSVDAILARNLVRDLEVFLPLAVLGAPEMFFGKVVWWVWLPAAAWMIVVFLLPVLSREHLRAGDLLAGTLVIETPEAKLLVDHAARSSAPPAPDVEQTRFTPAQLAIYGEHELEALAGLIHKIDQGKASTHDQLVIAHTIANKIGYEGDAPVREPGRFLRSFYKAQRAALEKQLLFGKRKARKDR